MLVLSLTACNESKDDIKTKAVDRWAAIVNNDYEKAYGMYADSYQKIESYDGFRLRLETAKLQTKWEGAEFLSMSCEKEDICKVDLNLTYTYSFPRASMGSITHTTAIVETWLKKGSKWKFMPSVKD